MTALLVAMASAGSAFAQVPPGAGCEGIDKATEAQKVNPTFEDNIHSNIEDVAKVHRCKGAEQISSSLFEVRILGSVPSLNDRNSVLE